MKEYRDPVIIVAFFYAVAVALWLWSGSIFYLFNFIYIGSAIGIGMILFVRKVGWSRLFVQFMVGSYMLVFLGVIARENMMLTGFWYYLFLGVFQAAVIHYAVAKIFGPFLFGRGWCGYACWTAMILDLLPYRTRQTERKKKLGITRYVLFIAAFVYVGSLFVFHVAELEKIMYVTFLVGNALYYAVGVGLAYAFKDNRAFCKYICPITVFLKPASYYAFARVRWDEAKCIDCKKCLSVCPMDVHMMDNSRKRRNATECILCETCVKACPKGALKV